MKIIDSHIHSLYYINRYIDFARKNKIDFSAQGLKKELRKNDIEKVISITSDFSLSTPIGLEQMKEQIEYDEIICCCAINPKKINEKGKKLTKTAIKQGVIKALKIHPGYYPVPPDSKVYTYFFNMAEKYACPVIIHTGDVLNKDALLEYTHPRRIDKVAVKFPDAKIIIAHLGNPWIVDAAEIVYKNDNVYADLSGLLIGDIKNKQLQIEQTRNAVKYALGYVDNPEKFVYGSDWPLVAMSNYIELIRAAIPIGEIEKIFYSNAKKLFNL